MIELLLAITFVDGVCTDTADDGTIVEWACTEVVQTPPPVTPPQAPTNNNWQIYNDTSRLDVTWTAGSYYAVLSGDPNPQQTLWYNGNEGRMDFLELNGDFSVTVRNVGLDYRTGGQWEYQFCGVIVWDSPGNYEFAVAGKRGQTDNTIEYKITRNSSSRQADIGSVLPTGKADIRVSRVGSVVTFEWSQPGAESWTTLPHNNLYAQRVPFGGSVRVGLITYGYSWPDEFAGSADSVEVQ